MHGGTVSYLNWPYIPHEHDPHDGVASRVGCRRLLPHFDLDPVKEGINIESVGKVVGIGISNVDALSSENGRTNTLI